MIPYDNFHVQLAENQFDALEKNYPSSKGSSQIGGRAIEIVKIYFTNSGWTLCDNVRVGIDLTFRKGKDEIEIEVKGTADNDIAWNKLFISGLPSCENLKKGIALYRVYSVFERTPMIAILKLGDHFDIKLENRWKIAKIS